MSDTTPAPTPLPPQVPEFPYVTLNLRWGNPAGRPLMPFYSHEDHPFGLSAETYKDRALELLTERMVEGETKVNCHIYHMSEQGSVMMGAWHFDADTMELPVWAPGTVP